jgi:Flp pilus assembly protein TadG
MPRSSPWADERGSSTLEFLTVGLLLLVPLVYLILTVSALEAGAFSAEGAARQAARVYALSGTESEARDSARRAVEFALDDFGADPDSAKVDISCTPAPDDCLTRRGYVTVTVAVRVALPLLPASVSQGGSVSVPLNASATQQVSRFRGDE